MKRGLLEVVRDALGEDRKEADHFFKWSKNGTNSGVFNKIYKYYNTIKYK